MVKKDEKDKKDKEIERLNNEILSMKNYIDRVNQENNKRFGENIELKREIHELKRKYNKLEKYVKYIQEYLLKDIFELMRYDGDDE